MRQFNGYFILYIVLGLMALGIHSLVPSLAHILISIIALAILSIAAIQALVATLQNYLLKRYPLNTNPLLQALPPVQTMQDRLFKIIWAGFIFLTLSFLGALLYLPDLLNHIQFTKLIFATLAWGLFASLLFGYYRSGWGNHVVTIRTMIGVILLAIAYFGSKWIERI